MAHLHIKNHQAWHHSTPTFAEAYTGSVLGYNSNYNFTVHVGLVGKMAQRHVTRL